MKKDTSAICPDTGHAKSHQRIIERTRYVYGKRWHFLTATIILPGIKLGRGSKQLYQLTLARAVILVSKPVSSEIKKIHQKQNLPSKFKMTLLHKGLGLYLAMLSADIVGNFIEVRSATNLWGIFSARPIVSETTYSLISFGVEFFIALIVFTLTDHYLQEFREWRQGFRPRSESHSKRTV